MRFFYSNILYNRNVLEWYTELSSSLYFGILNNDGINT